jgi:two-component system, HptB-dependent secretion and biofilm response regulator
MSTLPVSIINSIPKIDDMLKALVVDDSSVDCLILQKILLKQGYDVCIVTDGQMAIEMFGQFEPDIVFMDLYLPDMSGYEVTKILKESSGDIYVPVVFVTSETNLNTLEYCLKSGGDDYIVKPVIDSMLEAKTGALLRIKKMHDDLVREKKSISGYFEAQSKDLHDANKVIFNIHKPRFYNPQNINWSYEAQNILSGDIICSALDPSGNHVILVGDNTGHGLPAAIGSLITCETFYSMVNKGFDIQVVLEEINKKLFYLLPADRFLAACIIEIDEDYNVLKVWNAGLPRVLVCNNDGSFKQEVPSMHFPLGIKLVNSDDVVPIRINVNYGDYIYAYTDGLTETFNHSGEMYGEQRLLESIGLSHNNENRVEGIINQVQKFRGTVEQSDDMLLVELICYKPLMKKERKNKINEHIVLPMNWDAKFELHHDIIANINPVPVLMQTMAGIQGLGGHREKIFLILTEMYSNAVEHGMLKLDSNMKEEKDGFLKYYELRKERIDKLSSGKITIEIKHQVEMNKGVISIMMKDSGDGFDYEKILNELEVCSAKSGRGILIINDLCRKLEYKEGGRRLNIEYEWMFEGILNAA